MPFVIFSPLVLWVVLLIGFPSQPTQLEPFFEVLTQDVTLYIILISAALLAALMRQWNWWYWLGLASAVWFGISFHFNQPLHSQ